MSYKPGLSLFFSLAIWMTILSSLFSCSPGPLVQGSSTLKEDKTVLGYDEKGEAFSIDSMNGTPFLLFLRSGWCPTCKDAEKVMKESIIAYSGAKKTSIVALYLRDGRLLAGGEAESQEPEGFPRNSDWKAFSEEENLKEYISSSDRLSGLLKVDKLPAIAGFDQNGTVRGTIYGFQTNMAVKIKLLIGMIIKGNRKFKEEIEF